MSVPAGQSRRAEQETLVRQLQAAFPFQPLPELTVRRDAATRGDVPVPANDDGFIDARDVPPGATWPDSGDQHLLDGADAPVLIDGPAFVYYLPGYLVYALRHLDDHARVVGGTTLLAQAISIVTDLSPRSIDNYVQLDTRQRDAVVAVLRHVARFSVVHGREAQRALERHWLPRGR